MKARAWLMLGALLALSACDPEAGRTPKRNGGNDRVASECRARASTPYVSTGPRRDGSRFYSFTSTAEGTVICSGRMYQIKITVIFQHQTNGSRRGAVEGRDHLCHDALTCDGEAIYSRNRLNCLEYYRYDDFTQVTGWYFAEREARQVRIESAESRHRVGTSHKPREVCND